jgi:hypothetical protein
MWIVLLVLVLLGAQLNLTALVPLKSGDTPPPWWVGGRLLWPFAVQTRTLVPPGDALNTLTPILAIASATCFLLAAAALLRWVVPGRWFPWLIVAGAVLSIVLQVVWFFGWAIPPLLVDVALHCRRRPRQAVRYAVLWWTAPVNQGEPLGFPAQSRPSWRSPIVRGDGRALRPRQLTASAVDCGSTWVAGLSTAGRRLVGNLMDRA